MDPYSNLQQNVFKKILNSVDLGVFIQDTITKEIIWFNKGLKDLFFTNEKERVQDNEIFNLILKESEKLAKGGANYKAKRIEIEVNFKEFSNIYSLKIIKVNDKYLVGVIGDKSSEKILLDSLANVGYHYRTLLNLINTGVVLIDSSENILTVNDLFCQMTGYEAIDLLGQSVNNFILLEPKGPEFTRFNKGEDNFHIEFCQLRCKDMTFKDAVVSIGRIISGNSQTTHQIAIVSDLSEQMLYEKMKTRFIEITTHELRTPLAIIKSCTEILEQKEKFSNAETIKKIYEVLSRNINRLEKLISSVHEFKLIEDDAFYIVPNRIYLSDFITMLIDDLVSWSENKDKRKLNITFEDHRANKNTEIELFIDVDKFTQALFNVVENACQNSPSDMPVNINFVSTDKDFKVQVRDYGTGIPDTFTKEIIKPFYSEISRYYKGGLGLGLYITKNIVKKHHGKIDFKNLKNERGTVVEITLPNINFQ